MLKQVNIIKDGQFVQGAQFTSDADMNAWLSDNQTKKTWGEPGTYTVNVTDLTNYVDQESVRDQQRETAINRLRTLHGEIDSFTTMAEVKAALKFIIRAVVRL